MFNSILCLISSYLKMARQERRPTATPVRERSRSPTPAVRAGNVAAFVCPLCRLVFASQRALCGHMNAHKNRGWRGVNPPPGLKIEDFAEYGSFEPDDAESAIIGGGPVVNEVATGEQEENKPLVPDLNKSPPPEE